MKKFKKTINGTIREFTHHSRHKANSRSVALVKFLEYLKKEGKSDSQEIINAFKTGFNIAYKESKKRSKELLER